jgi:hypothetical protein
MIDDLCLCGADGTFTCGMPPMLGQMVTVCIYPMAGAACPALDDPNLSDELSLRYSVGCPPPPTTGPTSATASDGTPECCYPITAYGCAGRPIEVDGVARVARLSRRSDWV